MDFERNNANVIGRDTGRGANDMCKFLIRPIVEFDPYTIPNPKLFVCSSSTPPGGSVYGMCGYWRARTVPRKVFGIQRTGT
jgi:phytoene dehydrogenase-like protein